jgi:hypothetical protein
MRVNTKKKIRVHGIEIGIAVLAMFGLGGVAGPVERFDEKIIVQCQLQQLKRTGVN